MKRAENLVTILASVHTQKKKSIVIGRANIDKIVFIIVVFQHLNLCRMLKQEQLQCERGYDMLTTQIG